MKLWLSITTILFVLFGIFNTSVAAEGKILIGVSLPLTGPAAAAGEDARKALLYALEKFGEDQYEFIFEDDQCSGKGGLAVAHIFTNVKKVRGVLGPICSGALLTAGPIYQKAKTLVFGIATSSPEISELGSYVYRVSPNDADVALVLAEHVVSKGPKTVGLLTEITQFCEGFKNEFLKALQPEQIETVEATFNPGDPSIRNQILTLKQKGVTDLFINTQSEQGFILAMQQIQQLGWSPRIYTAYWGGSAAALSTLGASADGVEYVDLASPEELIASDQADVYAEFIKKFGPSASNPSIPPLVIDSFRIMTDALKMDDPLGFLDALNFHGLIGDIQFDKNGDITNLKGMMRFIKGGKIQRLGTD